MASVFTGLKTRALSRRRHHFDVPPTTTTADTSLRETKKLVTDSRPRHRKRHRQTSRSLQQSGEVSVSRGVPQRFVTSVTCVISTSYTNYASPKTRTRTTQPSSVTSPISFSEALVGPAGRRGEARRGNGRQGGMLLPLNSSHYSLLFSGAPG